MSLLWDVSGLAGLAGQNVLELVACAVPDSSLLRLQPYTVAVKLDYTASVAAASNLTFLCARICGIASTHAHLSKMPVISTMSRMSCPKLSPRTPGRTADSPVKNLSPSILLIRLWPECISNLPCTPRSQGYPSLWQFARICESAGAAFSSSGGRSWTIAEARVSKPSLWGMNK